VFANNTLSPLIRSFWMPLDRTLLLEIFPL
jgi:hypothetical protein